MYHSEKETKATGEWRDVYILPNGKIIEGEWQHNIIVDSINVLIACLMKNQNNIKGITHWAVGSGKEDWEAVNPSVEMDTGRTSLYNELGRKAVQTISFLDEENNEVQEHTNRILVVAVFEPEDCLGIWREFALFGGNATMTINSGIMIDHKIHSMYVKTTDVTVERQIRFIFN